jgi:hypothetical protein
MEVHIQKFVRCPMVNSLSCFFDYALSGGACRHFVPHKWHYLCSSSCDVTGISLKIDCIEVKEDEINVSL